MIQIGKGAFSTAYLQTDGSVLIKSIDPVKEAMAYGFFPSHRMFPEIQCVDSGEKFKYYKMKFYEKPKSLKKNLTPRQWRFYKALQEMKLIYNCDNSTGYDKLQKKFKTLPNEFKKEKEALLEALDGLSNYGLDMCFEISPRNVAIKGGKLILLDCFFFFRTLQQTLENRGYRLR